MLKFSGSSPHRRGPMPFSHPSKAMVFWGASALLRRHHNYYSRLLPATTAVYERYSSGSAALCKLLPAQRLSRSDDDAPTILSRGKNEVLDPLALLPHREERHCSRCRSSAKVVMAAPFRARPTTAKDDGRQAGGGSPGECPLKPKANQRSGRQRASQPSSPGRALSQKGRWLTFHSQLAIA